MKIRPVGAELFHADKRTGGRTDGWTEMKLIVVFRKFANGPENSENCRCPSLNSIGTPPGSSVGEQQPSCQDKTTSSLSQLCVTSSTGR